MTGDQILMKDRRYESIDTVKGIACIALVLIHIAAFSACMIAAGECG